MSVVDIDVQTSFRMDQDGKGEWKMKRSVELIVAVILALVSSGIAQETPVVGGAGNNPQMMSDGMCMMMNGPMMGMMGAADLAAWDGSVYFLNGNALLKLDSDLREVKSVELGDMAGMMKKMQESGMCPMCGNMMGPGGKPGMMGQGGQKGMMAHGQGMGMMGGEGGMMPIMKKMHQMHMMKMMGKAQIAADEAGVYLLRGGKLTVFDHDLDNMRSEQVSDMSADAANCPMCQKMVKQMQAGEGGMMMCPMMQQMMGGPGAGGMRGMMTGHKGQMGGPFSEAQVRAIADGEVTVAHRPVQLTVGPVGFRVLVFNLPGQADSTATLTGFLYPQGATDKGKTVQFSNMPMHFVGSTTIAASGAYELAIRVKRPDHGDVVVYLPLSVGE